LLIRPLWILLGGTVLKPAGFLIARFSIEKLIGELSAKNTATTIRIRDLMNNRFFIILNTSLSALSAIILVIINNSPKAKDH
jgi:hypothetical protein